MTVLLGLAAPSFTGVVHDSSGAIVPGAVVIVRPAGATERQVVTGPDGRFAVDAPETGDVTVVVRAGGFAETTKRFSASDRASVVSLTVVPANVLETVTVTPSRSEQRVVDVPASVSILKSDEIRQSPAVVA